MFWIVSKELLPVVSKHIEPERLVMETHRNYIYCVKVYEFVTDTEANPIGNVNGGSSMSVQQPYLRIFWFHHLHSCALAVFQVNIIPKQNYPVLCSTTNAHAPI